MIPALPFLYLPDAITLMLLLILFGMLRSTAIDHLRQELLFIRKEMLLYWLNNGLNPGDRGLWALRNLIESSMMLAPGLSPGRFVFLDKFQRKVTRRRIALAFPNPSHEARLLIECTANKNGREKLKRFQTETELALGAFFLVGSLTGLLLSFVILSRMLKRTIAHRKKNRTDFFFDMLERVLGSLGRKAQQAGYAMQGMSRCPRLLGMGN